MKVDGYLYRAMMLSLCMISLVKSEKVDESSSEQTCTWEERGTCGNGYRDPNLKPFPVGLDGEVKDFHAFISPDFSTFYNATPGTIKPVETTFHGMFAKFINMSNKRVVVYWKSTAKNQAPVYISDLAPFGAAGTATYSRHEFLVTEPKDTTKIITKFTMVSHNSLYHYDPFGSLDAAKKELKAEEFELYKLQHQNLAFNELYYHATGRQWLGLYGRKHAPRFPIWPADSFDQIHTVTTKAAHIVKPVPDDFAKAKVGWYGLTPEEEEKLKAYQSPEETLTMTMKVLSVAPRAFEIQNFLSEEEVHHILELATGIKLSRSTTKAGTIGEGTTNDATRTSLNSWVARNRSPIIDVIYRRAADLMQIDDAYFRWRKEDEKDLVPESTHSITERLQLVHYDAGQQYTPHHVSP